MFKNALASVAALVFAGTAAQAATVVFVDNMSNGNVRNSDSATSVWTWASSADQNKWTETGGRMIYTPAQTATTGNAWGSGLRTEIVFPTTSASDMLTLELRGFQYSYPNPASTNNFQFDFSFSSAGTSINGSQDAVQFRFIYNPSTNATYIKLAQKVDLVGTNDALTGSGNSGLLSTTPINLTGKVTGLDLSVTNASYVFKLYGDGLSGGSVEYIGNFPREFTPLDTSVTPATGWNAANGSTALRFNTQFSGDTTPADGFGTATFSMDSITVLSSPVPEPTMLGVLMLAGVGLLRRRSA